MRKIEFIVVHCSDSPDDRDDGFKEINAWHLAKGWKDDNGIGCGYHYVIRRDGTIEVGRTEDEVGAHVQGANATSIGICMVGTKSFAKAQFAALTRLVEGLRVKYPGAEVRGHRDFPSAKAQGKTCPNFDVKVYFNNIL